MKTIDLKRIREALPSRAVVNLGKTDKGTIYIDILVQPGLYIKGNQEEQVDLDQVNKWLDEIIGKENIMEVYTIDTGRHWTIYLNRTPLEFINLEDKDVNSYAGIKII